jgi:hypothetical protein
MNKINKLSGAILYVSLLAFISFAVYILYINQEVFYTAHDRSEFIFGTPFFHTLMSKPFGLMQYVGAWLTQFFYNPALGSGMLVAIWALIFVVGAKAFRLQGSASALMLLPVACLLTSVVDLGYWIYVSTIRGYWFSQSVGYLLMVLLLWVARCTPRKWHIVWYLLGFCLYPVLGWFAMVFVFCLAVSEKITWRECVALAVVIFTAGIWHGLLYSELNFRDVVFAGLPRFDTPSDKTDSLTYPFLLLGVVSVLIQLCAKYLSKWFVPVVCAIAGVVYTSSFMYRDKNYIDEMRMVRYASVDDWKGVLNVVNESQSPSVSMVMLGNVAMMYEGGLFDRSFKMHNINVKDGRTDTLHVSFLEIASPLVYFNYGMLNESVRLNYECAVQAGFSPFYLKMLSRCALALGDDKLVERYTTLLHHNMFYADWQPSKAPEKVRQLMKCYPDELTGVENSDSYIVNSISLWSDSDIKVASEQALFYSMMRCDSQRFWASLRNYIKLHINEQFPVHAQEAYIMFLDKKPEAKRMMLPVEQATYERYKKFWTTLETHIKNGASREDTAERMRGEFGDTYWYYNVFGRKIL